MVLGRRDDHVEAPVIELLFKIDRALFPHAHAQVRKQAVQLPHGTRQKVRPDGRHSSQTVAPGHPPFRLPRHCLQVFQLGEDHTGTPHDLLPGRRHDRSIPATLYKHSAKMILRRGNLR